MIECLHLYPVTTTQLIYMTHLEFTTQKFLGICLLYRLKNQGKGNWVLPINLFNYLRIINILVGRKRNRWKELLTFLCPISFLLTGFSNQKKPKSIDTEIQKIKIDVSMDSLRITRWNTNGNIQALKTHEISKLSKSYFD